MVAIQSAIIRKFRSFDIADYLNPYHFIVLGISTAAILARVLWILNIPNEPISDFAVFQQHAVQLANGQYPDNIALQGIGYPGALGLFYSLVGDHSILTGKWFNVIFASLTLVVSYYLFKKLFGDRRRALMAYFLFAFVPTNIAYTSVIGTEIFFTFLFLSTILLQLSTFDWRIRYPLMGIIIGIGALTKPYLIVYPALILIADWFTHREFRQAFGRVAITIGCMVIVLAPNTIKNYEQFHMFIPTEYNGPINLFINSNSDNTTGAWMPIEQITDVSPTFKAELAQHGVNYPNINLDKELPALNSIYEHEAERWIIKHPFQYGELGLLRVNNTFFGDAGDVQFYAMNGVSTDQPTFVRGLRIWFDIATIVKNLLSLSSFILLILVLREILLHLRRPLGPSRELIVVALAIGLYVAVFFCTEGQPKYSFPLFAVQSYATVFLLDIASKRMALKNVAQDEVLADQPTLKQSALSRFARFQAKREKN